MADVDVEEDLINVGLHGLEVVTFTSEEGKPIKDLDIGARFRSVYSECAETGEGWGDGVRVSIIAPTSTHLTRLFSVGVLPRGTQVTMMYDAGDQQLLWGVGASPSEVTAWVSDPADLL